MSSQILLTSHKKEAAEVFCKLTEAYEYNDMATIKEIYRNLEKGHFAAASDTLTDVQRMHRSLVALRSKLSALAKEIRNLRHSDEYREIAAITDWNEHFATVKQQLQGELERIKGFYDDNN